MRSAKATYHKERCKETVFAYRTVRIRQNNTGYFTEIDLTRLEGMCWDKSLHNLSSYSPARQSGQQVRSREVK